jgi:transcriptional regulator with XRE-family HTH domain
MTPDELRNARRERGWRLEDVAAAIGVTGATLSRWERGLQKPPDAALNAWVRVVTRQRFAAVRARRPRRRPRGILPRLGELFLADVTSGARASQAGWREPRELGLTTDDVLSFGDEIERDALGRIRIKFNSPLESVRRGREFLYYRQTTDHEQRRLEAALTDLVFPLLDQANAAVAAIMAIGVAEMIRLTAGSLESARARLNHDPVRLLEMPRAGAEVVLAALGLSTPQDISGPVAEMGLTGALSNATQDLRALEEARALAREVCTDQIARELGREIVHALGAAWTVTAVLDRKGILVSTSEGTNRLARAFWERMTVPRHTILDRWHSVMLAADESATDEKQLGLLLWTWPEEL